MNKRNKIKKFKKILSEKRREKAFKLADVSLWAMRETINGNGLASSILAMAKTQSLLLEYKVIEQELNYCIKNGKRKHWSGERIILAN